MEKLEGGPAKLFTDMYEEMVSEVFLSIHKYPGLDGKTNIKVQGTREAVMHCAERLCYECIREICKSEGSPENCKKAAEELMHVLLCNLHERLEEETWNTQK